jgi:hypothetical protein
LQRSVAPEENLDEKTFVPAAAANPIESGLKSVND